VSSQLAGVLVAFGECQLVGVLVALSEYSTSWGASSFW